MPQYNRRQTGAPTGAGRRFVYRNGGFERNQPSNNGYRPRRGQGDMSEGVRETLQKVTQALSLLAKRIEKIEGGPDKASGRSDSDQAKHTGPPLHVTSNNDDFASVVKDMYRLVQLDHHADNWKELPNSLLERLKKFSDDIRPPMPDEEFRRQITSITSVYAARICETVRQHIAAKRSQIASSAATKDDTDINRAKEIVNKQLSKRLGRRLDDSKRERLLDQAASAVGSGRQPPDTDGDGFQVVVNSKKKPSGSPGTVSTPAKRRKRESTPPPVSTHNHYSVLANVTTGDIEPDDQIEIIEDAEEVDVLAKATPHNDVAAVTETHRPPSNRTLESFLAKAKTCAQVEHMKPATAAASLGLAKAKTCAQVEQITPATAAASLEKGSPTTTRSRSRTMSVDGASGMARPSARSLQTTDGVRVYTPSAKDDWTVTPAEGTNVIIIGGSNLRRVSSIPENWEIHCLPGAKLHHINNALEHLIFTGSDTLTTVYIQAGINHRDEAPDVYAQQVDRLAELASVSTLRLAFVGVPRPPTLTDLQRRNIDALNARMWEIFGVNYIHPICDDHVEILRDDRFRIHHTAFTCKKIMTTVRKHAQVVFNLN